MKGTYLGEFEEIVLLAVGILREGAYGVSIRQEIEDQTKRNVNIGAVHTALHRLEKTGSPDAERALRDARLGPIGGGAREVMADLVARTLPL